MRRTASPTPALTGTRQTVRAATQRVHISQHQCICGGFSIQLRISDRLFRLADEDPHFQESHWGKEVYAKLLKLKQEYDPKGLFYGHHAVGSELWSADGNCRV